MKRTPPTTHTAPHEAPGTENGGKPVLGCVIFNLTCFPLIFPVSKSRSLRSLIVPTLISPRELTNSFVGRAGDHLCDDEIRPRSRE